MIIPRHYDKSPDSMATFLLFWNPRSLNVDHGNAPSCHDRQFLGFAELLSKVNVKAKFLMVSSHLRKLQPWL